MTSLSSEPSRRGVARSLTPPEPPPRGTEGAGPAAPARDSMTRVRTSVVLVAPSSARSTFRRVLDVLDAPIDALFKDMEVTSGDGPQLDWTLQMEVEALQAVTGRAGPGPFHLVGYSGGAAVALAFVASHGDRVRTLTLIEPPWVGNDSWSTSEAAFWEAYD